jgi:hypothetical protein
MKKFLTHLVVAVEQSQFDEIIKRLDEIAKLLSLNLVKSEKTLGKQVKILNDAGFQPKDIANILDKKPNHIHQILHSLRTKRNSNENKGESE